MEEDENTEVYKDEDSQDETTEEEPDFSSEYDPETETDTESESEERLLNLPLHQEPGQIPGQPGKGWSGQAFRVFGQAYQENAAW